MYGGYQGSYDAYGNQYMAGQQGHPQPQQQQQQHQHQQHQQPQPYYQGVNPYANYNAAHLPPPPPPPAPGAHYSTYPATTTTTTTTGYYKPAQNAQNADYSNHQGYTHHQGYDTAVYNFAQESGPKSNPWSQRGAGGGGGHPGRHARQGSGDNKEYYCDTCKISCAGGIAYKEHLVGKAHKRREECAKSGVGLTNLAKNKLTYRCDLCMVNCTGEDTYTAHVRGGKHQKTANLHKKMGKYVPEDVPTIIAPGEDGTAIETKAKPKWHQQAIPGTKKVIGINTVQFVGGTKLNSTGQIEEKKREVALAVSSAGKSTSSSSSTSSALNPFQDGAPQIEVENERVRELMEKEKVQPVGAEYVIDERDTTGKLVRYLCKICECAFTDPNAKDVHVKGRRHRLAYKNKVDSALFVSPKPSSKKNKKKVSSSSSGAMTSSAAPEGHPTAPRIQWFQRVDSLGAQNSIIVDERSVEKKYELLNPGVEYNQNTEMFLKEVEYLFSQVAAKMGEVEPLEAATTTTTTSEAAEKDSGAPQMLLLSLRRSGVYAKNTYLREDECAEMWLQTTPAPDAALLKRIVVVFGEVAMGESQTGLTIEPDPASAICLLIRTPHLVVPYLRITCTSPQFQYKDDIEKSEFAQKQACSEVYKQNRRREWYTNHGEYLNSCKQVIRLLRDARSRHPPWTFLDDYPLELIVHNVISSTSLTLNVLEAFKRVLEALASGYLFNAFLVDPCETTRVNVLDALSDEQKHELTASAQTFVRQIAVNRIHEVLGIQRLDEFSTPEAASMSRKRPLEPNVFMEYSENPDDVEDVNDGDDDDENGEEMVEDDGGGGAMETENLEEEDVKNQDNGDDDDGVPDIKRGRLEEAEPEGAEPMEATF